MASAHINARTVADSLIYITAKAGCILRCKHCKIVSLVEAGNPNEAAEKVSRRAAPENKALTLEQLRQMDGEPVWIPMPDGSGYGDWAIVDIGAQTELLKAVGIEASHDESEYGKTWLAYARKPEGSKKS
jgi:hypothetical protein